MPQSQGPCQLLSHCLFVFFLVFFFIPEVIFKVITFPYLVSLTFFLREIRKCGVTMGSVVHQMCETDDSWNLAPRKLQDMWKISCTIFFTLSLVLDVTEGEFWSEGPETQNL
eukprot:TRINITY_DN66964_c8_g3_i2.p2 TRINITY_DN66964_c8_g3~~TRINITY_DN66964_c8_g3_i2.p2  ORF type:complete len:112 (+),score=8.44 TRINITY_DN66964_c8_g3_i2:276-611(+)